MEVALADEAAGVLSEEVDIDVEEVDVDVEEMEDDEVDVVLVVAGRGTAGGAIMGWPVILRASFGVAAGEEVMWVKNKSMSGRQSASTSTAYT